MSDAPVFLQGDSVVLSPLDGSDIHAYLRFINDQKNDVFTQHALFPRNESMLKSFLDDKAISENSLFLGIYSGENQQHIGNIALDNIDWVNRHGEYKILLDHGASGKGYAFEASQLLLQHAFSKLNLHRVYLGVNATHGKAISLYERLGFTREGIAREHLEINGHYIDVLRMGLLCSEFRAT